jgi:regulator of protease activity HflC (stomatin/prohibitin superfamily)
MVGTIITLVVVAAAVIGLLVYLIKNTPVFKVHEQQAVIIERFGKFTGKVLGPGLHFILPFGIEERKKFYESGRTVDYVDTRERSVDLPSQSVITKDNVQLEVDSIAYYQITDPQKAVYNITDVVVAVNQLIKTVLRDVIGDTMLQDLLGGREEINEKLREQVVKASGDWGIMIRSVELQSITPPQTYVEAMRKVSEAELAKKAAITKAEGEKQARILEAEGEADKISRIYNAIYGSHLTDEVLKVRYLDALEKIADGKATKIFMPFPSNPASGNFFQQAFGMAAGFDAYQNQQPPASEPEEQQTTPILPAAEGTGQKKIIRRIVKRPVPAPAVKPGTPATPPPSQPKKS